MSTLSCAELRELAPELALGTLPGDQRAAAIAHLAHCGECQLLVEELSDAADAVLLIAPEADPPRGFARRVIAGLEPSRPRRRLRLAAVAAVGALAVGLGIGVTTELFDHGGRSTPPFALHEPGVRTARFVPAPGEHVEGQVFTDADNPSWVFMTLHDNGSEEGYVCQLDLADGRSVKVGSFQLHHGRGSWGREVEVNISEIRTVRLVDPSGQTAATASLA